MNIRHIAGRTQASFSPSSRIAPDVGACARNAASIILGTAMHPDGKDIYRSIWKNKLAGESGLAYGGGNLRIDLALNVLPPGEKLLDVGCGSGVLGGVLLAEGRYSEVHGLEISEEAAAKAQDRGVTAHAFDLNQGRFPCPDVFFDAVTCLAVIEHVLDPRSLLSEIARVLKPGGVLVLDTPNIRYAKHLWSLLVKKRFPVTAGDAEDLRLAYDGGHLHYFTHRDIIGLLEERGLHLEQYPCVLPVRLQQGVLGSVARASSRVSSLRELLSVEIFVVATKSRVPSPA